MESIKYMRFKEGDKIEVLVEPHGTSMKYYCIKYRPKKRFNLFNPWRMLVQVWNGSSVTYDQPVLISNFDYACEYAESLKNNPLLINQHYEREDKRYKKACEAREKELKERKRTAKF